MYNNNKPHDKSKSILQQLSEKPTPTPPKSDRRRVMNGKRRRRGY